MGSLKYIWYVFHRWLSCSIVQRGLVGRVEKLVKIRDGFDGVSGMRLMDCGRKGSVMSLSGLVQLPSKEWDTKLPSDEEDESDLMDKDDDGLSIVQALSFHSGSSTVVCANGVLGREWCR